MGAPVWATTQIKGKDLLCNLLKVASTLVVAHGCKIRKGKAKLEQVSLLHQEEPVKTVGHHYLTVQNDGANKTSSNQE